MSSLTPEMPLSSEPLFSKDESIAEAGRKIMAFRLEKPLSYEEELETATSAVSVHETRKNLRRMRTALRLFAPYFESGLLNAYRKRFRKFMRLLGPSRDTAVFLQDLDLFISDGEKIGAFQGQQRQALQRMRHYWYQRQMAADDAVRLYMAKDQYRALLADFQSFTKETGEGVRSIDDPATPIKTGHLAPIMIYEKVALVRAFDGQLVGAALDQLHKLRIRFKELRYTLEFFEPILGPSASSVISSVKELAVILGQVNDARVALEMMADAKGDEQAAAMPFYQASKEAQLQRLIDDVPNQWADFENQGWRQQLAQSMTVL